MCTIFVHITCIVYYCILYVLYCIVDSVKNVSMYSVIIPLVSMKYL